MDRKFIQSRYRGCLLGGAVGDALGYPVEFMSEEAIIAKYGPEGIQTLEDAGQPACISDDTQMTLFAANGLIYASVTGAAEEDAVWSAYQEWLVTQTAVAPDAGPRKMWLSREKRLFARRAPGNTCLDALRGGIPGAVTAPLNHSKGCGTVMRAAPFGLSTLNRGRDNNEQPVSERAARDAALTHGHPAAWNSSAALAQIIFNIIGSPTENACPLEVSALHGTAVGNLYDGLQKAVKLARDRSVSDLEGIHALGEGWVADEALLIAVFCAVRYQYDFAAGIRAAVNHGGDSDSTGAICGNILGAWLGEDAVKQAFDLDNLELRDVIETLADDLLTVAWGETRSEPLETIWRPKRGEWYRKYPFRSASLADDPKCQEESGGNVPSCEREMTRLGLFVDLCCPSDTGCLAEGGTKASFFSGNSDQELEDLYLSYIRSPSEVFVPLLGVSASGGTAERSMDCLWRAILSHAFYRRNPMYSSVKEGTSEKIRICAAEGELSTVRPYLKRRSRAFFQTPPKRYSRGDIFLWREMMLHFDDPLFNELDLNGFVEEFLAHFRYVVKRPLRRNADMGVPSLDPRGMSGGEISGDFWVNVGLPLLCRNFQELWPEAAPGQTRRLITNDVLGRWDWIWDLPPVTALESLLRNEVSEAPLPPRQAGLFYTPLTKKALEICFRAHRDQRDMGGLPYVIHPLHLAERMETEEEICAALLHDVMEDTPITLEDLKREGFPAAVLEAVALLTHTDGVPYMDYVARLKVNAIARKVKLADLEHNSDLTRLDVITESTEKRLRKYRAAAALLKR